VVAAGGALLMTGGVVGAAAGVAAVTVGVGFGAEGR